MRYRHLLRLGGATVIAVGILTVSLSAALTNFQTDVATAIDRGLTWLANNNAFTGGAGDATGLAVEALLEKRPSGIPTDPPQGYHNATPIDQGRLRTAAVYMINQTNANGAGFAAYRDGSRMFAGSGPRLRSSRRWTSWSTGRSRARKQAGIGVTTAPVAMIRQRRNSPQRA
jgi:hypothetical protein